MINKSIYTIKVADVTSMDTSVDIRPGAFAQITMPMRLRGVVCTKCEGLLGSTES